VTVAAYPLERARDAFLAEYTLLDELAASLSDEQLLLPSRCLGWSVCDVLCHLDLGMVEILVALASPTDRPADTDSAAYWRDCCAPGEPDLGTPGGLGWSPPRTRGPAGWCGTCG
jgi:hypothetical protein